jgi:hypothetical protein
MIYLTNLSSRQKRLLKNGVAQLIGLSGLPLRGALFLCLCEELYSFVLARSPDESGVTTKIRTAHGEHVDI